MGLPWSSTACSLPALGVHSPKPHRRPRSTQKGLGSDSGYSSTPLCLGSLGSRTKVRANSDGACFNLSTQADAGGSPSSGTASQRKPISNTTKQKPRACSWVPGSHNSPAMLATACSPDEHCLLTVDNGTVSGMPLKQKGRWQSALDG